MKCKGVRREFGAKIKVKKKSEKKFIKRWKSESKRKQSKRKIKDKVLLKAISSLHFCNGHF